MKQLGHGNATGGGNVYEHVFVVARALGRPVPKGTRVHHVNENRSDNRGRNLVLLQNASEHKQLHSRMRARAATGHVRWKKCQYCKQYDDPANLFVRDQPNNTKTYHRKCNRDYQRKRKAI